MLAYIIHTLFFTYTLLLFVRIVGSWFPAFAEHRIMGFLRYYTDPYLNLFRKIIPPIGGVFDLSPLLGYFALQFMERFILHIIH